MIVVNAEKIRLTGRKLDQKMRYRYSGFPGGLKAKPYREWVEEAPEEVIRKAVKGMLPRNSLGRKMLTKIKIYSGPDHPHEAQNPNPYEVKSSRPPKAA